MNTKKKGLYLGLLLSMLGVGSAVKAYKVTILNATPFTVEYTLDLVARGDFSGALAPGHSRSFDTVGWLTRGVRATVFEEPKSALVDPILGIQGSRAYKIPESDRYYSTGIGNAYFVIYGPFLSGSKIKYGITWRKLSGIGSS